MKLMRIIIIAAIATFLYNSNTFCHTLKPRLVLKIVLRGTYTLSNCDGSHFFLVEVQLCNNTDSVCSFVAYSCETNLSLVVDNKAIVICGNKCGGNFPQLINVKPNQTFSIPVILKVDRYDEVIDKPIKVGLVMLNCHDFSEVLKLILQKKEKGEDLIWSSPFFLDGYGQPFEIK